MEETGTGSGPAGSGERAAVAIGVAAVLVVYALRGGSYDVVVRGEAGIALWWLVLGGVLFGVMPRRLPRIPAWVVLGGFALLVVWTTIAFGWTESDERTSVELARVLHHLGLLTLAICFLRPSTAGAATAGVTVAAVTICALAVGSRLWPGSFPGDRVAEAFTANRLNYPLNYWNGVSAWGAMATTLALAWGVHARSAMLRALSLAAVPLCVVTVYLTYSRAGVIGIAVGTLVVFVASRSRVVVAISVAAVAVAAFLGIEAVRGADAVAQATGTAGRGTIVLALLVGALLAGAVAAGLRRAGADERLRVPRRQARLGFGAAGVLALMVAVIALPPVADRALDEFRSDPPPAAQQRGDADPAARLTTAGGNRNNLYGSALDAYRSDPSHGTGPGTFEFWWNRDAVDREYVRDAHSLFLEAMAESGLPGLLGVLIICGGGLFVLVRVRVRVKGRSQTGAACAALAGFTVWVVHAGVDWMWEETAVTALALVLLGAGCVMLGGPRRALGWPVRAAVAAVAVLAILGQLPAVVGTSQVRSSAEALAADDPQRALTVAQDAAEVWPWAAAPRVQRALAEEAIGDLPAAAADVREAERREPTNWRHPLLGARIALQRGRTREALAEFERARKLRPLSAIFERR